MQQRLLWIAMAGAGLLAGCGGGGGNSSEPVTGTPPVNNTATVSLSGSAAKGLMANATVTVHAVNSDGTVASAALASTTTNAQGQYTLSFTGTKDQPVVVKVTATAGTTHLDEVTGQAQPLPPGFSMRALLVPTTTGTVTTSASVTPFSEMAVAAAAKATGGITPASAAQATTTVTQLLGFDPVKVAVAPVANATGPDQQKLAVMLTAVSQLAASDALGCGSGSAGEKVQCVVSSLANAASTSSLKLTTPGGTDASAALSGAVKTVLADAQLSGPVSPILLGGIVDKLACEGSACTPSNSTGGANAVANGIAAAKAMFTEIKSDWTTMFSRGGISSVAGGAVNAEAWKFQQAMKDVQVPAEALLKDAGAMLMGIDLFNDYKAGRTTVNGRGRARDVTANAGGDFSTFNAVGCSIYTDSTTQQLAQNPAQAGAIGCRATFYIERTQVGDTVSVTEWRHGFTLVPKGEGAFDYTSRVYSRTRTCNAGGCTVTGQWLDNGDSIGSVTTALSSEFGRVTGFTIQGQLPATFAMGGNTLTSAASQWSIAGTRSFDEKGLSTNAIEGEFTSLDGSGATLSTLKIKSGSLKEMLFAWGPDGERMDPAKAPAGSATEATPASAGLNFVFSTPQAEVEGDLLVGDAVWDKSGRALLPGKAMLMGALRNVSDGQAKEFIRGTLQATLKGYGQYDAYAPNSANNFHTTEVSFSGHVTAPNRPKLQLTLGTSVDSHQSNPSAGNLTYSSTLNGKTRMAIAIAASRQTNGKMNYSFTEAAAGLSFSWIEGADKADLMLGTTKIGEISRSAKGVTFSNGDFMSLDFGL